MLRFHVHAHVTDLASSIDFYTKLFASPPSRVEIDYAKWMLDDPRINFAISTRGGTPGVDHLGIQADDDAELGELKGRAGRAELAMLDSGETTCCYARSDKHWLVDPQGIAWEQFRTLENIPVFAAQASRKADAACCANDPTTGAGRQTASQGCGCGPATASASSSASTCC